jgi:hypothetical protein
MSEFRTPENTPTFSPVSCSEQFQAIFASRESLPNPEHQLALAILEEAFESLQKNWGVKDPKARRLFLDAWDWFHSDESDWTFSFSNICHLLKIEEGYIRGGLIEYRPVVRQEVRQRVVRGDYFVQPVDYEGRAEKAATN